MSIILKHIFRSILRNRLAGMLIVLSLSISTAVVYLNLNINTDLLAVSQNLFDSMFGGFDISVSDEENGIYVDSAEFNDCEILPIDYDGGVYLSEYRTAAATVIKLGSDLEKAVEHELITLEEGTLPDSENEVGVSHKKAVYYNLNVGDTFSVMTETDTVEYTISCIFKEIGLFTDERREVIEMMTGYDLSQTVDILYIDIGESDDVEPLVSVLRTNRPEWTVEIIGEDITASEDLDGIKRILYMMIAISVMIGYYVISSVSTQMIEARIPVIGTFRSVGASRSTMNILLLVENAVYGLIGGVFGVLLGEVLRFLLTVVYYKASEAQRPINLVFVLIGFGFSVMLQIFITSVTLIKSGNRSIKETIFRTPAVATEISGKVTVIGLIFVIIAAALHIFNFKYIFAVNVVSFLLALIGCICLVPFLLKKISSFFARKFMLKGSGTLFLSLKNISVSRIDISSAILTSTVTALALVIFMCTASVDSFFAEYSNNYPYDILIKGLDCPADNYSFLRDVRGVEKMTTEFWDYGNITVNGQPVKICMVRRGGYSNGITFEKTDENTLRDGHAIIDKLFASEYNLKKGSQMQIFNGEITYSLIVDGFCDSGIFNSDRRTIIITENDFYKYVELSPAMIGIDLKENMKIDRVMSLLATAIYDNTGENARVYSKKDYLADELETVQKALAVFSVIPFFTVLLAVLGLVNNQIIAYNRKRREYAILYSVAMNRKQLGQMVFSELILIFAFGSIYGVLMSIWLIRIFRDIVFGLIAYLDIEYDFIKIGLIIILTLLLLCLTAAIPQKMAKKTNVVEEIKYE